MYSYQMNQVPRETRGQQKPVVILILFMVSVLKRITMGN